VLLRREARIEKRVASSEKKKRQRGRQECLPHRKQFGSSDPLWRGDWSRKPGGLL